VNDKGKASCETNRKNVRARRAARAARVLNRPARYSALGAAPAVPAVFLASGEQPETPGVGDMVSGLVGFVAHVGGTFVTQQPAVAAGAVAAGGGVLYLKMREADLLGGDDGFATRRQLRQRVSRRALLRQRKTLRPSLAEVPGRQVPTTEVGVRLGRCRKTGVQVWSSIEDSIVVIAPMGAGKTALMGNWVLDAPGPALVTSSKDDILRLTESARRDKGGSVRVFNPQGLAGRSSDLLWDPVVGCKDPVVALRRARYLLEGSDSTAGMENRGFWESSSFKVLKSFLWAADMEGLTLLDVARWSKKPHETPATAIFEKYADVAPFGWAEDLQQTQAPAQKGSTGKTTTLDNVFGTLSLTFMCLSTPVIAQSILKAHEPGVPPFDIKEFLSSEADTIYLLGRHDGMGGIGPLFSVLTGEIYEAARMRASMTAGGRLDPPLSMDLDEAALICPVPLPDWTADSRGLGITVQAAFQSRSQIEQRWGRTGAETIWDNCTGAVLGGLKGDQHLESLSRLTGTKRVREESNSETPGPNGTSASRSWRWTKEPTMTGADIKNLEPGEILIIRRHIKAVVTRYQMVWDRKDVKGLAKAQKKRTRVELRARKRKAATAAGPADVWTTAPTPAPAPPANPWATAPVAAEASAWGAAPAPGPAEPWSPPAPAVSPWTTAPATSAWSTSGVPGPRPHLSVVPSEPAAPPAPARPALPAPPVPDFAPTAHLEQLPQQQAPAEQPAESETATPAPPTPLRKTGTTNSVQIDASDLGAF
jgi:type IV secretion system protein VirD4